MPKAINLDRFRYITSEGWRALTAIEMGLKNHEVVPLELALKISHMKRGCSAFLRIVREQLIPNRLVTFVTVSKQSYSGYRLTNLGYDFLALNQLFKSEELCELGSMIGAGKESDVYAAVSGSKCGRSVYSDEANLKTLPKFGEVVVVKFHRLGRTSFRKVKDKRDYHQHRTKCSWIYLDRLASQREFDMMKALFDNDIPVPRPLAHNRNAVVMSFVDDAVPLYRILPNVLRANEAHVARSLYYQAKCILQKIISMGFVHGDFNEFNLMVSGLNENPNNAEQIPKLYVIDFPQMISRDHGLADSIYQRDVDGLLNFFGRFFDIADSEMPCLCIDEIKRTNNKDVELRAPGYVFPHNSSKKSKYALEDSLIGAVAHLEISPEESEFSDSNSHSESGTFSSNSNIDTQSEITSDSDSNEDSKADNPVPKLNIMEKNHEGTSKERIVKVKVREVSGLIDEITVQERHRRERRKQKQSDFQRRLKRSNRAAMKQQSHNSIKSELFLFG